MKLYWWNEVPNLGDRLTQLLLFHRGVAVEWTPVQQAEMVGIGSVLELFDGKAVTVFGTGRAGPKAPRTDLTRANVLALRGMKTWELTDRHSEPVLGDPGLLAADLIPHRRDAYVATVAHWKDQERMMTLYPGARFVDVRGDPMDALVAIADAERVVSSSLHGIVLADAFGKPRLWDWFGGTQAGGFKFHDYGSVVGAFEPGEWKQVDASSTKKELRQCLSQHLNRDAATQPSR